ncbi:MAG: APC family permease [Sphaerochaeta sp.]|uniref:APC family permease n=1 Tax=Sphaerochaeta sp. TaxID=1972642 RepID=UPI002FC60815
MQKKLGTFDSVHLLVGGMIGSAIFSLSGLTIYLAGPASILSWILGALILFAYGLQTAELASRYPHSGGVFTFPALLLGKTREQGKLWGWISAWAYLFGCIAGAAFSAIYIGIYLSVAFPFFSTLQVPLALIAVLFSGILNGLRFRITGRTTTFLTLFLAGTLIVYAAAVFTGGSWNPALFKPFFSQGSGGATGFFDALPLAMVAYGAIVALSFLVGEVENPNKTIPKAMAIAMAVVLVLYLFVLVATLGLVSSGYLEANAGMRYIPLYAAASFVPSLSFLTPLISISAVLALLTTMIVTMALAARTLQASSENGVLAPFLAKENAKSGAAIPATIVITLVTGFFSAIPQLTNLLINLGALCNVIVVAIVCLTVLAERKQHPTLEQGYFRAPGGKALPLITLVVLVATYIPGVLQGGWQLWAATALYYVIGMVLYVLRRKAA